MFALQDLGSIDGHAVLGTNRVAACRTPSPFGRSEPILKGSGRTRRRPRGAGGAVFATAFAPGRRSSSSLATFGANLPDKT